MVKALLQLPSLDTVKGFVAVGRRMSVSLAADDLCVTQSAMSKQIRNLEEAIGIRLFQRNWRSLTFTPQGEQLFDALNGCVQQLQDGFERVGLGSRRPVTISASVGVSALWLLPRLAHFQQRHPDVELRIATTNVIMDLVAEGVDLAIRYCPESMAPAGAVRLFGESIAPVATPDLAVHGFDTAQEIGRLVLLDFEDKHEWLTWDGWLASRGLSASMARRVIRFNHYDQAIQAAAAGQGIALGRLELLGQMLQDGRLEMLRAVNARRSSHSYWVVQASSSPRADVQRVTAWILEFRDQRLPRTARTGASDFRSTTLISGGEDRTVVR
jgi:DNA-binding transcriptional LysR family regulator